MPKAKAKTKKAVKGKGVNEIWGWVTLAIVALIIFGVAGWYFLTTINF